MADVFNIDAKLVIAGVAVKGGLNLGKLKFDIDTTAFKKLVVEAAKSAKQVKAKFDNIQLKQLRIVVNQKSLRRVEAQIRKVVQNALGGINLNIAGAAGKGIASSKRVAAGSGASTGLSAIDERTAREVEALKKRISLDKQSRKRISTIDAQGQRKGLALQKKVTAEKQKSDIARASAHKKAISEIDARTQREVTAIKQLMALDAQRRLQAIRSGGSGSAPGVSARGVLGGGGISSFGGGAGGAGGARGGGGVGGAGAVPGGFGGGAGSVKKVSSALVQMTGNTAKANTEMEQLKELSEQVGKKAAAFRAVAIALNTVVTSAQAAVRFIIDFSDSLLEVNKILQLSGPALQAFGNRIVELSSKTGVAIDQTVKISEAFARAGLAGRGFGSITQLTDRALTGLQGTTLDASQTTELFIQILQQVEGGARGLNKELVTTAKLFDVLGKAEDITASKATDVQAAFKRSAASIFATGVSIEQATALISVLQERTQRGGDVIGTALKTVAARISSSSSQATKALNEIGVSTIDANGNLRNLFDVLEDTAVAFNGLTESEQANVAVKAAGIRQVEIFRSAVRDFNRVQDVNNELVNASGDAARKAGIEQEKLGVIISKMEIALQGLVKTASESTIGKAFVGAVKQLELFLTGLVTLDKSLGGVISSFALFGAAAAGIKFIFPLITGIGSAFFKLIQSQKASAVAMGGIQKGGQAVTGTVVGQMNPALQGTATTIQQATINMGALGAATAQTAAQAQRLAAAQGITGAGPNMRGAGRPGLQFGTPPQTGKLTKGMDKLNGVFKKVVGNVFTLGLVSSIAGGQIQSFAKGMRDAGNSAGAAAADIGGGALAGAGTGALVGSIFGTVGTVAGGIIGALVGAFEPLRRAFGFVRNETEDLTRQFKKLGIIQAETGDNASEVAAQLDKALRNLKAVKDIEGKNLDIDLRDDPKELIAKREQQRTSALKGAEASFDISTVGKEFANQLNDTINKILASQGKPGDEPLDVGGAGLNIADSPTLKKAGEKTIREIEKALITTAEHFDLDPQIIKSIVEKNLQKIADAPITFKGLLKGVAAISKGEAPVREQKKFGAAIPLILKESKAAIAAAAASKLTGTRIERSVAARERTESAIGAVGGMSPLGNIEKFIDIPVSKLEVSLRTFIADLGREVIKLNEAQLKASTPQKQLAEAMAKNAQSNLKFIQDRIALEKTDASKRAREAFAKAPGGANKLFQELPKLVGSFKAEGVEIDANIRGKLEQQKKSLVKFMQTASDLDIAELFSVDDNTAKEIGKRFSRTTGDAAKAVFEALVGAQKQIVAKRIVDPNKQRQINEEALLPVAGDIDALGKKRFDATKESAKKFLVILSKLDEKGFKVITQTNSLLVADLKKRLSEEARLLGLDKRRREAASLSAKAMIEELTGIRRLVAERKIETQLMDANIVASKTRLSTLNKEEISLKNTTKTASNKVAIEDQLEIVTKKRATEEITLSSLVGKQRISDMRNILKLAKEATSTSRKAAGEERNRIGVLADISTLLSVDRTKLEGFNAELATLGAQFKNSQGELAAEAQAVDQAFKQIQTSIEQDPATNAREKGIAITKLAEERDVQLGNIRKRGAALALAQAKAEAEIIAKRREAIKQVSQQLLSNQQEQVTAQKEIIDATNALSDAFEGYLQAVDGAIMATTRYNLGLELASVSATKITGGFSGIASQLEVVQTAFRDAERLAGELGASERTLVDIRRESINQQLALFNDLLSQQTSAARAFFTSSAEDQANLFRGIQDAQGIADLLGGSFEAFQKKSGEAGALNELGKQILSLPQEMRQRIQEAITSIGVTGATVGGFTAEELQTAIDSAVFGESKELKVDPLFEVQKRIAQLTEEQALLATEELIAANEGVQAAKEQLEVAQEAKDLAEIQLERVKEEGDKLRTKLADLQGSLKTVLLKQDQTARQGFVSVTSAVARAANDVITKLPDAFSVKIAESLRDVLGQAKSAVADVRGVGVVSESRATPDQRGTADAKVRVEAGKNKAANQQAANRAGAKSSQLLPATDTRSNNANNAGSDRDIIGELIKEVQILNKTSEANLQATEDIRDSEVNVAGVTAATISAPPEINVKVEGTSTVTVTGFESGVARIAAALAETFGGFATESESRMIATEVVENIRAELLKRGIITPNTL